MIDAAGREIVRHGASGFLGEMNLLSGQTVFLTAVVTEPMRYIAVDREVLRRLLFEDGSLSDLLLSAFVERRELLQQREGIGLEIVGPRESAETRRLLEFARRLRLPHTWLAPEESEEAAALIEQLEPAEIPLVRLPGGAELRAAEQRRALAGAGDRARARAARGGRPARRRRRAGRPRRGGLRRLGGPRHAGDREHRARRPGGHLAQDRELPRLPGRHQRHRADQPRGRPGAQVRRPHRDALPRPRARAGRRPPRRQARGRQRGRGAGGAALAPAPNTGACRSTTSTSTRGSASSTPPARPRRSSAAAQRVGVIGGGNSAAQAAVWLARGGALVTLLHRRADLARRCPTT